ncbi:hypothetical protein [Roseibaca sp. Y0-43]|uniref:hypothetical protein n=1 Tax=Roseibaca sp. Y0-43 TaxID=2816854 RepID=UPI001D0CB422|nr:hypothetical protein [Roseibaca sp. Y0-43]
MLISAASRRMGRLALLKESLEMRRAALAATFVALFAAPAFALTVSDVDTDGDSLISFAEMAVLYPEMTEAEFAAVDANADSMVDEAELSAALEAELIAAPAQ